LEWYTQLLSEAVVVEHQALLQQMEAAPVAVVEQE
jgi:hypothetical protein